MLTLHRETALSIILGTVAVAVIVQLFLRLRSSIIKANIKKRALKIFAGPTAHWLYGNLHQLGAPHEFLSQFIGHVKEFKKCSTFWIGPFIVSLRLYDPEYLQTICKTAEPKFRMMYRFLEPWIGQGLLLSSGKKWARARRLLTPAFHFDILKPYTKVFGESAHIMMDKWRSHLREEGGEATSFDVFEPVSLMTLDSMLKCAFSYDSDVQLQGKSIPYIEAVYELTELAATRMRTPHHYLDWLYYFSYSGYRFRRACRITHALSEHVIQSRRKALQEKEKQIRQKRCLDFLDILLEAKDTDGVGLTDEEIRDEVDTFLFEGHDTTASGISWCLYNLARHPEYQDLCREEIDKVMGDRDMLVWEDMSELPMLTMCIKESLRLHPPVPGISRLTTTPLALPDQRTVPTDICVEISIYGIHHNPDVWPDPEKFDPYRFTTENTSSRPSHAYVPFSAGPRNCIGQNFAMNEMRACIAVVLRNFLLTVDEKKQAAEVPELILRAKDGLWINIKPISAQ